MLKSVFIALPAFGRVNCSETTSSLMALSRLLLKKGWDFNFCTQSYPNIADVRNLFATIWYDLTQDSHLLFVDADMSFEPKMVLDMLESEKPLVGCMYPKKTLPIEFVGKLKPSELKIENGFLEVEALGAGVLLIRRDCMTAIVESDPVLSDTNLSYYTYRDVLAKLGAFRVIRAFEEIHGETGKISEDYSFCRRYKDAGGECWASIDHPVTHVGPYGFTGKFRDRLNAA